MQEHGKYKTSYKPILGDTPFPMSAECSAMGIKQFDMRYKLSPIISSLSAGATDFL